ncbi:MAG: hypothetical protein NTZ10_00715 [Candidatus Saganbacteria bacterium]|nr:hypothetical protein [Candidatus Saganbacteria bacterium]
MVKTESVGPKTVAAYYSSAVNKVKNMADSIVNLVKSKPDIPNEKSGEESFNVLLAKMNSVPGSFLVQEIHRNKNKFPV